MTHVHKDLIIPVLLNSWQTFDAEYNMGDNGSHCTSHQNPYLQCDNEFVTKCFPV